MSYSCLLKTRTLSILFSVLCAGTQLALFYPTPAAAQVDTSYDATFLQWSALASASVTSPVAAVTGDIVYNWTAPDQRIVSLVVKMPHPGAGAGTVVLPPVPAGADARPYFDTALEQVRSTGASVLDIPHGTYTFQTLAAGGVSQLLIQNLADVTIEGHNSTLIFTQNAIGINVNTSQRLLIKHLSIEYSLHMASLGTIEQSGSQRVLVIDPAYPVTASDQVYQIVQVNKVSHRWLHNGERDIMEPGSPAPAIYAGNQTYTSSTFSQLTPGKQFIVFHHWYGGVAVQVGDSPGPTQSEDVVLDRITVRSGPGFGFYGYGIKRGFAIINSRVAPAEGALLSTEYDGIHVLEVGGDLDLSGNLISGQGDDAINLNNAISLASSVNGTSLVVGAYSRFISTGDSLAYFDSQDRFVGTTSVTSTAADGGLNYIVGTTGLTNYQLTDVIRDTSVIDSRFVVLNNRIENCNCHGLLVQVPNGLVQGNRFTRTNYNAIRLLTSTGTFLEGVGAINVIVQSNTIVNTGRDTSIVMPWAAISAYSAVAPSNLSGYPVNNELLITENTITDAMNACITVENSFNVTVTYNACNAVNSLGLEPGSLNIGNSTTVTLASNTRSGSSLGISIDAPSTHSITTQAGY